MQIPAPVGGWNAADALAGMPITDAVILDNWIPRSSSCEIRRGSVPQASGSATPVQSLMSYRGGATGDKLFAATGGKIYDVSASGAAFVSPVYTGATVNRWNYCAFANANGQWLIAVNGADTPIGYNAGAWATLPAITGSSGSIVLTPANLIAVAPHQGRLLFIEKNSLHVWFPAAGAVGGAMQLLDLGSVFNKGGRLVAVDSWSWQFGLTADQFAVFMTDQGQIAVYAGIDPSIAGSWSLTGVYDFGTPLGPRSLVKYGADLAIITSDGIVPLSKALKLDRAQDNTVALTGKISPAFSAAVRAYRSNLGWQGILYAGDTTTHNITSLGGSLAIFNIPTMTDATSMQFVQNMATGAWCRFTGINALCWETANNAIYFGGTDGVYQWDVGASDAGAVITADLKTAFSNFGASRVKKFEMVRPLIFAPNVLRPTLDIDVDYQERVPTAQPTVVGVSGADSQIRYDFTSSSGIGYVGAVRLQLALRSTTASDIVLTDQGGDTLGINVTDSVLIDSGLPFDVPCQLVSFDVMFTLGGQL